MLFQPSNIYPSTLSGIGAGTVDVTQGLNVSWQVNGDTPMTAYQVRIYQNDSGSTLMYDSGSVSVSPAFETHDKYGNPTFYTFLISAASLSSAGIVNGYVNGYKMLIKQWWSANDYVEQTSASVFITRSQPTISIDAIANPVASSSVTITATYAQAQGDPISTVEWVFALAGSESNPIRRTGAINTQILSFDADGLITGNTYSIMCTVVTANGMEASTGFVQFSVSYNSSFISTSYTLSQMKNSSAVYLAMENLGNNILAYPYTDSTKTTNGITFTVNGEGDISASGTASADAKFKIAEGTLSTLGYTAGQKLVIASGNNAAIVEVTETNSSNVVVSTVSGVDPLQYIVPNTSGTLTFYLVVKKGMALSPAVTLSPVICEERQIVSVNDLMVQMTPIQDLHGYSSPWPAGGGKNKLPNLRYVGTNRIALGQTVEYTTLMIPLTAGNYTLAITHTSTVNWRVYERHGSTNTVLGRLTPGGGTDSFTFTVASDTNYSFSIYDTGGVDSDVITQFWLVSGSDAGTYSPYENICPISGRTGLSVYVSPTQDPDDATVYAVDWSTQAGTVYGGTLDVVTGVLNVTHSIIDLGNVSWSKDNNRAGVFYGSVAGRKSVSYVLACSEYTVRNIGVTTTYDMYVSGYSSYGGNVIFVRDTRFASNTGTEYGAGAAGIKVVYELATPITYQLTAQEVALLVTNNIWSDSGDVSVSYTKSNGSVAVKSGSIVTITDSKAVDIQVPQFTPTISSVSVYRYLQGENYLRPVCNITDGNYKFLDYYAPSQMTISYLVKAATSYGDLFIQTSQFKPVFWFYSILLCDQDSAGVYHVAKEYVFKYGVESGAVSNSNSPTLQTNFTPYPNRQPISSLYKTGKLTSYIGTVDGQNRYSDTVSLQNAIYDISTSTLTKFLKTRKGDVIMVDTSGAIQMQTEDKTVEQALKATIEWAEVGDSSDISIVSVSQDGFWPLA